MEEKPDRRIRNICLMRAYILHEVWRYRVVHTIIRGDRQDEKGPDMKTPLKPTVSDSALSVTVLDGSPRKHAIRGFRGSQPFSIILWHMDGVWNVELTSRWRTYKTKLTLDEMEQAFGLTEEHACSSEKFIRSGDDLMIPGPDNVHDVDWIDQMVTITLTSAIKEAVRTVLKGNR